MQRLLSLTCFALITLVACSSKRDRPPTLHELAEPHLAAFERFDGWARRAALGADAFSRPSALRETAFTPLRDESDVLGAWIVSAGPGARTVSLHEGMSVPAVRWLRHPRASLSQLDLARTAIAPTARAPLRDCILVSKNRTDSGNASPTRVIVAFAIE